MKRFFDVVASGIGLILLSPLFIILTIWIKCDSTGSVFYRQIRVGRNNRDFQLLKFRSMRVGSDKKGLITVGGRDHGLHGLVIISVSINWMSFLN